MPLMRYDTGDMARPAEGPCPCGRTLPSFEDIEGRFRRFAGLPPGTRTRVNGLIAAIESFPPDQIGFLRRYQIHQDKENRYTLRVYSDGPVPAAFHEHIRKHWDSQVGVAGTLVAITEKEEIVNAPSGKRLDFISELTTDAYATPPADQP
jgi:phenylacetate-CoA ligase